MEKNKPFEITITLAKPGIGVFFPHLGFVNAIKIIVQNIDYSDLSKTKMLICVHDSRPPHGFINTEKLFHLREVPDKWQKPIKDRLWLKKVELMGTT